jgi:hypothetical protein
MNSFLVHHKTADPGVAKGSPAEQAPFKGPQRRRTPAAAPLELPKPNLAGANRRQEWCYEKRLV